MECITTTFDNPRPSAHPHRRLPRGAVRAARQVDRQRSRCAGPLLPKKSRPRRVVCHHQPLADNNRPRDHTRWVAGVWGWFLAWRCYLFVVAVFALLSHSNGERGKVTDSLERGASRLDDFAPRTPLRHVQHRIDLTRVLQRHSISSNNIALVSLIPETLERLAHHASEFLVHAADIEGLCKGIDESLVKCLGEWSPIPCTYVELHHPDSWLVWPASAAPCPCVKLHAVESGHASHVRTFIACVLFCEVDFTILWIVCSMYTVAAVCTSHS
jgi:hypothetical protein